MKILLMGATGGIGSAIKESLKEHSFEDYENEIDWLIFAQGIINESSIEQTFEVNTNLCISLTKRLIRNIKRGVIYISSTSGIRGNTRFPIYSASKAAVNSYAQTMARSYADIQFYALCPGPTNTKMWQSLGLAGEAQEPSEVARAVKEIMDGKYKSGDIITVRDGIITV